MDSKAQEKIIDVMFGRDSKLSNVKKKKKKKNKKLIYIFFLGEYYFDLSKEN